MKYERMNLVKPKLFFMQIGFELTMQARQALKCTAAEETEIQSYVCIEFPAQKGMFNG